MLSYMGETWGDRQTPLFVMVFDWQTLSTECFMQDKKRKAEGDDAEAEVEGATTEKKKKKKKSEAAAE